jgi:hypothetical protein
MAKLQRDLSEFIGLLTSTGVEFVVVGGHAVAFHGHPRFTGDIDILLRPTRDNAERVLRALNAFGFCSLDLSPADFTTQERIVQLGRPPNRIDLLTSISAVSFDEAWTTRVSGKLGDHQVDFLGWDALIRNKSASNRDKDRLDVKKLQAIAAKKR